MNNHHPPRNNPPQKSSSKRGTSAMLCCLASAALLLAGGCVSTIKVYKYNHIIEKEDPIFWATETGFFIFVQSLIPDLYWGSLRSKPPFLLFPLALLDLPFSLATDIVMYPFDQYNYNVHVVPRQAHKYLKYIFQSKYNVNHDNTLRYIEYLNALDDCYFITAGVDSPDAFDSIWEASNKKNVYSHFPKLALMPRLHEEQYWRLYNSAFNLPDEGAAQLKANLSKNPSTPKDIILDMGKNNFLPASTGNNPKEVTP